MNVVKTIAIGFFLDIYILASLFIAPITLLIVFVYWVYSRRNRKQETPDQKCIVCKKDKRRIDEDGICTDCNKALDGLYDTINEDTDLEVDDDVIPWMSIEVVPAGMPEKELANIDIRLDLETGMVYTVRDGIYREIGSDM